MIFGKNEKGFTIIELVVTVFIFTSAVLAIYGFFASMISESNNSISRLKAVYLAQEGMEIVKNIRDNNFLSGALWNNGLDDGEYEVDYSNTSLSSFTSRYLKVGSGGFYNYSSGTDTPFRRKIILKSAVDDYGFEYVKVSVIVSWLEKRKEYDESVIEKIYDVQNL